jgi:hypothetical protein
MKPCEDRSFEGSEVIALLRHQYSKTDEKQPSRLVWTEACWNSRACDLSTTMNNKSTARSLSLTQLIFKRFSGHGHGEHYHYQAGDLLKPYNGLRAPMVPKFHLKVANAFGTLMWFWVFYRLRQDYGHFLVCFLICALFSSFSFVRVINIMSTSTRQTVTVFIILACFYCKYGINNSFARWNFFLLLFFSRSTPFLQLISFMQCFMISVYNFITCPEILYMTN